MDNMDRRTIAQEYLDSLEQWRRATYRRNRAGRALVSITNVQAPHMATQLKEAAEQVLSEAVSGFSVTFTVSKKVDNSQYLKAKRLVMVAARHDQLGPFGARQELRQAVRDFLWMGETSTLPRSMIAAAVESAEHNVRRYEDRFVENELC